MKRLSLRPYPGAVIVCGTRAEYLATHKRRFGRPCAVDLKANYGRMDAEWNAKTGGIYLVWAVDQARMAHELCHVLFHVFELCKMEPRAGNEEPFCYMLSQLMLEAR